MADANTVVKGVETKLSAWVALNPARVLVVFAVGFVLGFVAKHFI